MRKFLRALPLKWRAMVTGIEEAKDLATLPLDELIGNLKVYEMILASDGVASKPIKEKFMPIALKANVTRGQTSNDNVCQDRSDEDEDEEEEEFNLIVRNLWKLFNKGNRFERENRFGNSGDKFDRGRGGRSKGVGSSRRERRCYGCGSKNHFVDDCLRAKVKKAFIGGAWSDSNDDDQIEKDATCLMAIGSQKIQRFPGVRVRGVRVCGVRVGGVRFGVRVRGVRVGGIRIGGVRVGGVRVRGVKVRGVQVGGVRVRGVRDGGVRVGGVRVGVVRVGGVRVDGVRVGGVRFGGVRVSGVRVRGV
ncbi:putative reverse transcriptase domain-containing protein [Tanacetum coccineum]|uniref:Reverse transcriptase domain-containing protein n=1 Tax=Tanacetum coccineum TaxID=301880 RepID=A0ABQ5EE11_9ASTR